jgi:hypothetical protein
VLNGVTSLIDKNLLQQSEQEGEKVRLVMLETIREFGLEALTLHGEMETTRAAHAAYYLQLSEEALIRDRELGSKGFEAQQLSVLARVEARLGNYDKTREHYAELLPLVREINDKAESLRQSSGIPRSPVERKV